ncbi:MAG TPA: hypothetical protein VLT47_13920 [Anaeromyxobacteraceae bacterium]|nr:hypothetical protein [Anaeromyxobacteraceae bacterium]
MAEVKKGGGFHAFEQRVHQLEEEDAKAEKKVQGTTEGAKRTTPEAPKAERKEPK